MNAFIRLSWLVLGGIVGCAPPDSTAFLDRVPEPELPRPTAAPQTSWADGTPLLTLGSPFAGPVAYRVSQSFGGSWSHDVPELYHAIDIIIPANTPLHAMRGGVLRSCSTDQGGSTGTWCHGLGQTAAVIDPITNTAVAMSHMNSLNRNLVDGQWVHEGQLLGWSGGEGDGPEDGSSTDDHVHVEVIFPAPETNDFFTGVTTVPWLLRTSNGVIDPANTAGRNLNFCATSQAHTVVGSAETIYRENRDAGVEADALPPLDGATGSAFAQETESDWSFVSYGEALFLAVDRGQACDGGSAGTVGPWTGWLATNGDTWAPTTPGGFDMMSAIADGAAAYGLSEDADATNWENLNLRMAAGWGWWTAPGKAVHAYRSRWLRGEPWVVILAETRAGDPETWQFVERLDLDY